MELKTTFIRYVEFVLILFFSLPGLVQAQENYEIQVYASSTQPARQTIFELHSNYTAKGGKQTIDGVLPTNHSWHKTLEITHGIIENFEMGFYLFTNYTPGQGWQVIGTHIRPRWAAPNKWKLPVGCSLSAEIGWQQAAYSAETFSLELRPIFDKTIGNYYFSFNPTLGFGFAGVGAGGSPEFAPSFKFSTTLSEKLALGAEYYSGLGTVSHWNTGPDQTHAIFAAADLYLDPKWELNLGIGYGLTKSTDKLVLKAFFGRRIQWKKKDSRQE